MSLVPPELATAFNKHLKERADDQARQKAEQQARNIEAEKRAKEAAEYRRQHPEQFVYITILKNRDDDRYCNDPIVWVTRAEEAMDEILTAFAEDQLGVNDEDDYEEDFDPVEQYFSDDRRYQMVHSGWAKLADVTKPKCLILPTR